MNLKIFSKSSNINNKKITVPSTFFLENMSNIQVEPTYILGREKNTSYL